MASGGSPPPITLNVGGIVYTTTWETIKNSKLPSMFSGKDEVTKDSKGNYFIDRDGSLFRHVLNFLRTRKLCLPQSFDEFEQLSEEAHFYQVGHLVDAIRTRHDDLGVIIIIAREADIFERGRQKRHFVVSGHIKFLQKVFGKDYINAPDKGHTIFDYELRRGIDVTFEANAFAHLHKHGLQLEGCNMGSGAAAAYHEYIFAGKKQI